MGRHKKKDEGKQTEAEMEKNEETNKGKEIERNEEEDEEKEMEDEKEKSPMKYVVWREIERMKEKDAERQMKKLAGFQHGTSAMLGYPEHWYDDDCNIPCPARDCNMLFHRRNIHQLGLHWENAVNPESRPPMTALTHAEHGILYHMLVQMTCPYCQFATVYGPRQVFDHEARQHGSSNTSRLNGVITLARQGGHYELAHPAIFKRMVLKIWENGHLRRSVLRRAHNGHLVMDPKQEDLESALSPPDLHPGVPGAPVCTAVRHQDFLMHLYPTHAYSGLDPFWKATWEDVRLRYNSGEI
ncbi:MAG: hypothetical protein ALECFALPRED_008000 [Alectoria fallacina]|uniref:Uncharacterized protein n=1 Tax=Alectoria fallacina TaxID=1903189 RepID=A0A8H3PFD6_9LECA|nr:MAG: hypothetical protein ALECFALPRED_008000 [Alectoria fallacina]